MALIIKLNRAAVRELLTSPEMLNDLRGRAQRIANAAGPGHEVETFTGRNRARATVRTESWQAKFHEATEHRLLRSLDAGR